MGTCQRLRAALTGVRTQSGAHSHYTMPAGEVHAGRWRYQHRPRPKKINKKESEECMTEGPPAKIFHLIQVLLF